MDSASQKSQLREDIRHRLLSFSSEELAAESRSLCRRLHDLMPREPQVIAAYYPLKDEADVKPLLTDLLRDGHHIYLPRVGKGDMVFRRIPHLQLARGVFNIPEPLADAPLLESSKLQIALIPGRAFDRKGNRLGRGNGGYDIWIRKQRSDNPATKLFGTAFECQIVQEVPIEPHDEKVDA
ncbi:MAG: 5-formyltetrahydrofolate cyclo-ligase, partial [Patescibacteria group bacterium]